MRVFVVDDSTLLRQQVIGLLSVLIGIEIVGEERFALESFLAICELKPDVVILDIHLSGGSGIDVLCRLKRLDSAPIVIMLTNNAAEPYRRKCMGAGADFFLDKSNDFQQLKAIVEGLSDRVKASVNTHSGYSGALQQGQ